MFWLASYPKSGSTWIRTILSAYRNNGSIDINRMYYDWGDPCNRYLQAVSPINLDELPRDAWSLLRYSMLLHMVTMEPKKNLIKTHGANCSFGSEKVPWIPTIFNHGIIYVARDPRDVCVSYADHIGYSIDEMIKFMNTAGACSVNMGNELIQPLDPWSRHVLTYIGKGDKVRGESVMLVRYEDLHHHAEDIISAILKFMGEDPDSDLVKKSVQACEFNKLQNQEKEHDFIERSGHQERFFRAGKAGGWRDVLTPSQAKQIEEDHEDVMKVLGYLKEDE